MSIVGRRNGRISYGKRVAKRQEGSKKARQSLKPSSPLAPALVPVPDGRVPRADSGAGNIFLDFYVFVYF